MIGLVEVVASPFDPQLGDAVLVHCECTSACGVPGCDGWAQTSLLDVFGDIAIVSCAGRAVEVPLAGLRPA